MKVFEDNRWAVSDEEWILVGDDYVFICRSQTGEERWFRLRQDVADLLFRRAAEVERLPWTGLVLAYQEGVGPWGDEPWYASDFHQAISQLMAPKDERLVEDGLDARAGRADLVAFLRPRCLAGDELVVDDGTMAYDRFPSASEEWTETGRPKEGTALIAYRRAGEAYELLRFELERSLLDRLCGTVPDLEAFRSGVRFPYHRVRVTDLLRALAAVEPRPMALHAFLRRAERERMPLVVQSAAYLPLAFPPSRSDGDA